MSLSLPIDWCQQAVRHRDNEPGAVERFGAIFNISKPSQCEDCTKKEGCLLAALFCKHGHIDGVSYTGCSCLLQELLRAEDLGNTTGDAL